MIPDLIDGVLPEGIHECTMDEVEARFGVFARSNRRLVLTRALRAYVDEARRIGVAVAVIVDGSYVTAKAEPGDIDLIMVLRPDFDRAADLPPFVYNVVSRRMCRRLYGFDIRVLVERGADYGKAVDFFSRIRPEDPGLRTIRRSKGMLRITL